MIKLTVICREAGSRYHDILIYAVDVRNPDDCIEVQDAVQSARENDLGDEANEMEILFAFQGDLEPRSDWRG